MQEDYFVVGRNPGKTYTVLYCEKGSELVFFFRLFLEVLSTTLEDIKDKMRKCHEELYI